MDVWLVFETNKNNPNAYWRTLVEVCANEELASKLKAVCEADIRDNHLGDRIITVEVWRAKDERNPEDIRYTGPHNYI